jgi:hypothetical protein
MLSGTWQIRKSISIDPIENQSQAQDVYLTSNENTVMP